MLYLVLSAREAQIMCMCVNSEKGYPTGMCEAVGVQSKDVPSLCAMIRVGHRRIRRSLPGTPSTGDRMSRGMEV